MLSIFGARLLFFVAAAVPSPVSERRHQFATVSLAVPCGFMLCKVGKALLRAVQGRLQYNVMMRCCCCLLLHAMTRAADLNDRIFNSHGFSTTCSEGERFGQSAL